MCILPLSLRVGLVLLDAKDFLSVEDECFFLFFE